MSKKPGVPPRIAVVRQTDAATPVDNASAVEKTASAIAFAIASGKFPAGSRLPSVRQLAQDFGINPNTVQVALGRLQVSGFASAHPRLGLVVRDIEQFGGISAWRYVFKSAQKLPGRASKICADLLEMRLVLLTAALQKIAAEPRSYDAEPVRRAVEKLALIVGTTPDDVTGIARAELHAIRALVLVVGQSVVTAVLNSIGEIYLEVPAMIDAMYVQPEDHVALWHEVLRRWQRGEFGARDVARLRSLLEGNDILVVKRFQAGFSGNDAVTPDRRPRIRATREKA